MKKIFSLIMACLLLAGCAHGISTLPSPEASLTVQPTKAQNDTTFTVQKRIGLVAHDACKPELLAWVKANASLLVEHKLFCTGTTGRLVAETLQKALPEKNAQITRFNSGSLGGDQQMGALISEKGLDILIFFIDPMTAHPHAADIQALMRLSRVYNIVIATTPSTADYVISSPLFLAPYTLDRPEYSSYINRKTP